MRIQLPLQILLAVVVGVIVLVVLVVLLSATDTALSLWQKLQQLSPWAGVIYLLGLLVIAMLTVAVSWRVLRAKPIGKKQAQQQVLNRDNLEQELQLQQQKGIDTSTAKAELTLYDQRRQRGEFIVALFGTISSGKSSLINALLPDAQQSTSIIGGTTQEIRYFDWNAAPHGEQAFRQYGIERIQLVDMPGFNQIQGETLAQEAVQEASRAQVVIFVCDNDLNRTEFEQIKTLLTLHKPIIIALNKSDLYSTTELASIEEKIRQYMPPESLWELVSIRTANTERVILVDAHGRESEQIRPVAPSVSTLQLTLYRWLRDHHESISQAQEHSTLQLASQQLQDSQDQYRQQQAAQLIRQYARRAILGALAAIAPGTDIVIQGALGTALTRALCRLYEVPAKEVDIDRFLSQAGSKLQRNTSITLAVAGNALKAFPGLGTIAGGLVHALAYGMIFHSLGQALAQSLAQATREQRPWQPAQGATIFEEQLIEHLETPAKYLVRTAVESIQQKRS